MMRSVTSSLTLFLLSLGLFLAVPAQAATKIINIRHWTAPDHTRVVLDVSDSTAFKLDKQERKLTITLEDVEFPKTLRRLFELKKPGVEKIEATPLPEGKVRIDLFLTEHTDAKVFQLAKIEEKPHRIVIDILFPEVEKQQSAERERVKAQERKKKKIVVIDPGHGGEDPGAVGRGGTKEKMVVLAIGKRVRDYINKKDGYQAFLTRTGDYYVPFKKRLKIAREYGADLFLSVHADANRDRRVMGMSVYRLSLRGASSEAAKILARNENLADIVGGVANGEPPKDESDPILLNMYQTNTLNASSAVAQTLLKNMGQVTRVKFATVQEAPFMVLKLPEVPSVLVETAFISNSREEKLLKSPKYQREIARAIADSAEEYLTYAEEQRNGNGKMDTKPKTTPASSVTEKDATGKEAPRVRKEDEAPRKPRIIVHTVKRGENLGMLANRYGTTVAAIAKLNKLNAQKPLWVNLKLRIPTRSVAESSPVVGPSRKGAVKAEEPEGEPKPRIVVHKVKQGENLGMLANRYDTTVAAIARLNKLNPKKPLWVGLRLKIPTRGIQAADRPADGGEQQEKAGRKKGKLPPGRKAYTLYTAQKGETLRSIAADHGTTRDVLLKLNRMTLKTRIRPGMKVKIPIAADEGEAMIEADQEPAKKTAAKKPGTKQGRAATYYVVKEGDNLDRVARKHRTTIAKLQRLNAGKRLEPLYVGLRLRVGP